MQSLGRYAKGTSEPITESSKVISSSEGSVAGKRVKQDAKLVASSALQHDGSSDSDGGDSDGGDVKRDLAPVTATSFKKGGDGGARNKIIPFGVVAAGKKKGSHRGKRAGVRQQGKAALTVRQGGKLGVVVLQ